MLTINNPPRQLIRSTGDAIIPSDEAVYFNRTASTQAVSIYSARGQKKAVFCYNLDATTVTITPASGTINGAASFALTGDGSSLWLIPDGVSNWQAVNSIATDLATALAGKAAVSTTKVYRALLSQSGTDAPVATVLENSLGGVPVWTRANPGEYLLTLASAFLGTATPIRDALFNDSGGTFDAVLGTDGGAHEYSLKTFAAADLFSPDDDCLAAYFFSIAVYP